MRRYLLIRNPIMLSLAVAAGAAAQQPEPQPPVPPAGQSEQEALEEEHVRTRIENGQSHASGARPELGPVIIGNPTTAVVTLRVGCSRRRSRRPGRCRTSSARCTTRSSS